MTPAQQTRQSTRNRNGEYASYQRDSPLARILHPDEDQLTAEAGLHGGELTPEEREATWLFAEKIAWYQAHDYAKTHPISDDDIDNLVDSAVSQVIHDIDTNPEKTAEVKSLRDWCWMHIHRTIMRGENPQKMDGATRKALRLLGERLPTGTQPDSPLVRKIGQAIYDESAGWKTRPKKQFWVSWHQKKETAILDAGDPTLIEGHSLITPAVEDHLAAYAVIADEHRFMSSRRPTGTRMSPESKEYQGRLTTVYQVATSFNAVATWAQTKQVEPVWPDDVTLTADQVESFQTRFTVSRAVREEAQAWMAGDSDGHDLFILFPNADAAQMETVAQFLLQTDQPSTHVQRWIWPYLAPEETTSRQAALRSAEGMESLLTTWRSQYDTDPRT